MAAGFVPLVQPVHRQVLRHKKPLALLFGIWGLYLFILFLRALDDRPDGLYASHINLWSDWPLHIAMANIFAYKNPADWFAYHPIYADGKFTYGFLCNLISGLLIRAGFSVYWAFILPSLAYVVLLLFGFYALFYLLLKSKKQALTAISLFFLSSGPGFIKFLRDLSNGYSLDRLIFPNADFDYSRIVKYEWYTGNFIGGMLFPQRALLLGMTIAVWVLVGLLYVLQERGPNRPLSQKKEAVIFFSCAVLTGIMVITHAHTFIALSIIVGAIAIVSHRHWVPFAFFYAIPALFVSITLYGFFIAGGIQNPHFIQWLPGWTAKGGLLSWLVMWLKIWGLMLPIALVGLVGLAGKPRQTQAFFVGSWGVFTFGNLIQMQPSEWDNSKLFLWAYFGFSGLAALVLAWIWQRGDRWLGRIDAVLVAIVLTLTGAVELIRLQSWEPDQFVHKHPITSQDDMQLAARVRAQTKPLARFLTAPIHNPWAMVWSARPVLLGRPIWAENFGFMTRQVEQDIKTMFLGGDRSAQLIAKYRLSYVVIGPAELWDCHANEPDFSRRYPLVFSNRNYRVYDTRSLWDKTTSSALSH